MTSDGEIFDSAWPFLRHAISPAGHDATVDSEVVERELLDLLDDAGWRLDSGAPLDGRDIWGVLQPLRRRAEAYGLIETVRTGPRARWGPRLIDE